MVRKFKVSGYIEPAIHMIIWASFFLIMWTQINTLGPFRKDDGSIYPPLIWNTVLNLVLFYLNVLYLVPHFLSKQRYKEYLFSVIALYIGIVFLNSIFDIFYSISLFSTEKESYSSEIGMNIITKILILSMSLAYGLTRNWIMNENFRKQLIRDNLTAELKYLKAQINPHFLFNTLNMAYASAIKSSDNVTADIIEKLSGLMRYVLYESNEDKVLLEKELKYIDSYIKLQLQRLSPELANQVKYEVKGDLQNHLITPMILIQFIENVFKHGIMLSSKPEISISISVYSNILVLETKNLKNNLNVIADNPGSGIGIRNVEERLMHLYPGRHKLEINDMDNVFNVKLELQL